MSKHYPTVSRRDFLKLLGLGGVGLGASAGLGAAAVSAPVFHDLDELMASPVAEFKRPWWIKEVDRPTCEIDWSIMKRFDYHEVMWAAGLKKALGPEEFDRVFRIGRESRVKWLKENRPGYTLKDVALHDALNWTPVSFLGPQTSPTPEGLGVSRYEGTPEENARMVRAFLRLHGASQVAFVELDTNTTEKLIYAYDTGFGANQGPRLDILDVDQPEEGEGYRVIPKKARWVIVYAMRMSDELMKRAPTQIGNRAAYYMYNLKTLLQGQLQNFLRTLGYMALGEASLFNALGVAPGFAVLAGMGELSRTGHVLTPEYGLRQRIFKVITDLPLAPGKPIDAGMNKFCYTCKKCADYCPPKALSQATEPYWETWDKPYLSPGVKAWYFPHEKCNAYWRQIGDCSICYGVCVFSKKREASYHDVFRWTVATNPVLNRFWRKADDFFFGSGLREDTEKFWELELPPWGYD